MGRCSLLMVVLMPVTNLVLVNIGGMTLPLMYTLMPLVSVTTVRAMVRREDVIGVPLCLGRRAVSVMAVVLQLMALPEAESSCGDVLGAHGEQTSRQQEK